MHPPIRLNPLALASPARLEKIIEPHLDELQAYPLYISIDKDVLTAPEAAVIWDSGQLHVPEVVTILDVSRGAAHDRLAGADIVGDWSSVMTRGWLSALLHRLEHPAADMNPAHASVSTSV